MLVDNGIVVVENVYRLMDEGLDAFEATKKGIGEVAWPIIASTATTLAAFVPLALWPGINRIYAIFTHNFNDCFRIFIVCCFSNYTCFVSCPYESR